MGKVEAWFDGLAEKGLIKGGQPLGAKGGSDPTAISGSRELATVTTGFHG